MFLYTWSRTLIICGICPGMYANVKSSFYFCPSSKTQLHLNQGQRTTFMLFELPHCIINLGKDPLHRNFHLHNHSYTGSLKICHPLDPRLLVLPFFIQLRKTITSALVGYTHDNTHFIFCQYIISFFLDIFFLNCFRFAFVSIV